MRRATIGFGLGIAVGISIVALYLSLWNRPQGHQSLASGTIRAEMRGMKVLPLYNPNSAEFTYLLTNRSTLDYKLPERFRVLRKSPDNVLHDDADGLGFPGDVLVPAGHTVEVSLRLEIGNVLDHVPNDAEKIDLARQLEEHLAGTVSYVILDEQHRYEIELPVRRGDKDDSLLR